MLHYESLLIGPLTFSLLIFRSFNQYYHKRFKKYNTVYVFSYIKTSDPVCLFCRGPVSTGRVSEVDDIGKWGFRTLLLMIEECGYWENIVSSLVVVYQPYEIESSDRPCFIQHHIYFFLPFSHFIK